MNDEYLAYLEAAVRDAGFEVKHDGGTLGNSNFRIEPIVRHGMAEQALAGEIAKAVFRDEQDGGCDLSAGMFGKSMTHLIRNIVRNYLAAPAAQEAVALAQRYRDMQGVPFGIPPEELSDWAAEAAAVLAAPVAAAPGIDLPTPRNREEAMALAKLALAYLGVVDAHIDAAILRCETDTSPKGGSESRDAAVADLVEAGMKMLPKDLPLGNTNVHNNTEVELVATMGELRAFAASVARLHAQAGDAEVIS